MSEKSQAGTNKVAIEKLDAKKHYSKRSDNRSDSLRTIVKNEMTNKTVQIPVIDDRLPVISTDPEIRPFFFGNPFVEKHTGILHFYRRSEIPSIAEKENCKMLCMVDVPAFFTCRELIHFVSPMENQINQMKIIRDEIVNKYMVLIDLRKAGSAQAFYKQYNNISFNSIEPDKCTLEFVKRIEMNDPIHNLKSMNIGFQSEISTIDAPTCTVCLEKMDDSERTPMDNTDFRTTMTILCNHSFHTECLYKWTDTTCPVCRHTQTPELVPDQKCFDCNQINDLWMCVICGNIGCGRYSQAHAYKHFEKTSHIFTLQVGSKLVWDYANDNYVHRLIQDSADGKVVEYDDSIDIDHKESEKMSAIQLEYTCLLTSQLENQRFFYEEKLREADERFSEQNRCIQQKTNSFESELKMLKKRCEELQEELDTATTSNSQTNQQLQQQMLKNQQVQQRNQKLQTELNEERQIAALLRKDKVLLTQQKEALEQLRRKEITALEEQVHDLMLHFESQAKIQDQLEQGKVTKAELEGVSVEIKEDQTAAKKTLKKRKK